MIVAQTKRYRFNIIGFSNSDSSNWRPKKSCPIHHCVLVPKRKDDDTGWESGLFCPMCGSHYTEKEAGTDEAIKGKFKGRTKPMIITGKKKKRFYDKQGNLITDPNIIDLIKTGATVYRYHEQKVEDPNPKKPKRHFVRK
jgi:hypothetical protein